MRKLLFMATIALIIFSGQSVFAETINLLTVNSSGSATGVIGGQYLAIWSPAQPTGTGYIKPFLRIQSKVAEQGYNTDSVTPAAPLDDKAGIWTHSIRLGDIPKVNINGVLYREFFLDVNESTNGGARFISLNQVQIFLSSSDPGSGVTSAGGTSA